MSGTDSNPATEAMRRTQRLLNPLIIILVPVIVVIVVGWSITVFGAALLFSAVYVTGVTWGGHALARLYQWRKDRR